jgi:CubicO group peptidase (beta-lactamase class C family)
VVGANGDLTVRHLLTMAAGLGGDETGFVSVDPTLP